MTYDEALANVFDLPDLTVERCIDVLLDGGYASGTAYANTIDLCIKGLQGSKAQQDFSLDISFYGVTAAATIRDVLQGLARYG